MAGASLSVGRRAGVGGWIPRAGAQIGADAKGRDDHEVGHAKGVRLLVLGP